MTTNPHEFRINGRPTDQAREAFGDLRIADQTDVTLNGTLIGEAHGLHDDLPGDDLPRGTSPTLPRAMADGWTPAHSEAARFLGECFAVGAVLGLVTEVTRPMREKRHG
jgi:hypothetical protein